MVFRLSGSGSNAKPLLYAQAIALTMCLSFSSVQMSALAGNNPPGFKRVPGKSYEDVGRFIVLTSPIELPEVPRYTGRATFVKGLKYPDNPTGPVVLLTYHVHEAAPEVLQWYSDSLKSYSWQVQQPQPETHQVLASKGHTECTVQAITYKGPGFRTEVTITYKVGR